MIKLGKALIILLMVFSLLSFNQTAFAKNSILESTGESTYKSCKCGEKLDSSSANYAICKQYCGSYAMNDFMLLVKRISDIILKFSGSLALLAMVLGGMMFLLSSGNKTLVERGRATMIGAAIGLTIVFFSYVIIKYSYELLTSQSKNKDDPFVAGWNEKK